MTIREALKLGYSKIKKTYRSANIDSEVLLSHVLGKSKEYLFANQESEIKNQDAKKFKVLLTRRQLGWPVAYLIGEKEFFGLKFFVAESVLIPRPETGTLVDLILEKIRTTSFARSRNLRILDIGTGSGCIIISLAKNVAEDFSLPKNGGLKTSATKNILYYASDISKQALAVAKKNAKLHNAKITFKQGSLLAPWKNQKFDIIVANLPYLWKLEHPSTKLEPKNALIADKKGLGLIEELLKQISTLHPEPCTLFLEFDPRQTRQIKSLATYYLPGFKTQVYKDLSGRNRFLFISSEA